MAALRIIAQDCQKSFMRYHAATMSHIHLGRNLRFEVD
jgi:hypothetical protein